MEIAMISINSIIPLFIVMGVGYLIGRLGYIDDKISKKISGFTFNILMPFNLFNSIYGNSGELQITFRLIVWIVIIEVVSFVIAYLLSNIITKERSKKGTLVQGIFRANMLVFGLPIAQAILPPDGVAMFTISLLIILPLQTLGTLLASEIYGQTDKKTNWIKALYKSIINPQTIAMIIAIIFVASNIKLPTAIYNGIKDVAKVPSPLSLMLIGAGFDFNSIVSDSKSLTLGTICRLFIMPLIITIILKWFSLSFNENFILLLLCCAPTATSIYTAVESAGLDKHLAKGIIVMTTLVSLISLTIWIYVLQMFLI